jgi:hypothetical protein
MLVYDHLAKAGGSEIKVSLLTAFRQNAILLKDHVHLGLEKVDYAFNSSVIEGILQSNNDQYRWMLLYEFQGIQYLPFRDKMFVIGSIREPCAYYLSDWAFSSRILRQENRTVENFNHLLGTSLHLNTTEEIAQFQQYVEEFSVKGRDRFTGRRPKNKQAGILTNRFMQSYFLPKRPFAIDDVDCWVHVEKLHKDLRKCLVKFMHQGGIIPHYEDFVQMLDEQGNRTTNLTPHAPCEAYFSEEATVQRVRTAEEFIYTTFNYTRCCGGGE